MFLKRFEPGKLTLIVAVMLPEALAFCSLAAAFERIAGCPFLNNRHVSFLKNRIIFMCSNERIFFGERTP